MRLARDSRKLISRFSRITEKSLLSEISHCTRPIPGALQMYTAHAILSVSLQSQYIIVFVFGKPRILGGSSQLAGAFVTKTAKSREIPLFVSCHNLDIYRDCL